MMVVARMKVVEGKADEFRQIMAGLGKEVRANEPGCSLYQLCATKDPHQFVMVERYADQDALGAHAQSAHVKAGFSKLASVLDGRAEIELLTEVE